MKRGAPEQESDDTADGDETADRAPDDDETKDYAPEGLFGLPERTGEWAPVVRDGAVVEDDGPTARPFVLAELAATAQVREVTSATFSYVDAMLTGRLSDQEFGRIRDEILGDAAALAFAAPAPPAHAAAAHEPAPVDPDLALLEAIQAQMAHGDCAAGMTQAEELLRRRPGHPVAERLLSEGRGAVAQLYQQHLGAGHDVPVLAVPSEDLPRLGLDRWAAYFLSRIDGRTSIDALVELAGLHRLDTLRVLYELARRGVITVQRCEPPAPGDSVAIARIRLQRRPRG